MKKGFARIIFLFVVLPPDDKKTLFSPVLESQRRENYLDQSWKIMIKLYIYFFLTCLSGLPYTPTLECLTKVKIMSKQEFDGRPDVISIKTHIKLHKCKTI